MANKNSGLGRGLDDLLDDNLPTKRVGKPLVIPKGEVSQGTTTVKPVNTTIYDTKTKPLYETKPRTRSVKSNFKK
ncbi:MAG: hypothetical protein E7653_06395 [Ruminococcaceae bacterium]|nr:hypothetical protein [Oscillospiraceae bacterium]